MTNLFQYKKFTMHAGGVSHFKIECDALLESDYATLAKLIANKLQFKEVYGIPRGGVPFGDALQQYVTSNNNNLLIVDDVFTTGTSMEEAKQKFLNKGFDSIFGVVVFARNKTPDWITPFFGLNGFFGQDA